MQSPLMSCLPFMMEDVMRETVAFLDVLRSVAREHGVRVISTISDNVLLLELSDLDNDVAAEAAGFGLTPHCRLVLMGDNQPVFLMKVNDLVNGGEVIVQLDPYAIFGLYYFNDGTPGIPDAVEPSRE